MFKTACKAAALAAMAGTVMGDAQSRRDELEARKVALADQMAALESELALASAEPAAAPAAKAAAPVDTVVAPAAIAQVDTVEVELAESATVAEAFPEPAGAEPTEIELLKKQIAELEAKAEMDRLKKQLADLKAAAPDESEVAPAPAPAPKPVEPTAPPPADAALPEAAPAEATELKPEEAPAPSDEPVAEATFPSFFGPINKPEATSTEEQREEPKPAPVTNTEEQKEEPKPAPVANTEEQNEEPKPAPVAEDPVEELRALRNGESKKTRSERRAANLKARQDRAARKTQLGSSVPLRDTATGSEQQKIRQVQNTAEDRAEVRRKRAERLRSLRSLRNGGHGDMPPVGEPNSELPAEEAESGPGIGSVLGFTAVVLAMLGVGAYGLKAKMAGSRVRRDSFASNSSRSSTGGVAQFVTSVQNVTGLTSRRNNRISLGV